VEGKRENSLINRAIEVDSAVHRIDEGNNKKGASRIRKEITGQKEEEERETPKSQEKKISDDRKSRANGGGGPKTEAPRRQRRGRTKREE